MFAYMVLSLTSLPFGLISGENGPLVSLMPEPIKLCLRFYKLLYPLLVRWNWSCESNSERVIILSGTTW